MSTTTPVYGPAQASALVNIESLDLLSCFADDGDLASAGLSAAEITIVRTMPAAAWSFPIQYKLAAYFDRQCN